MRKTFLVILILSLLLLTTAISASAAGFNVTIYNNRVPEFAIAFTDNLEGVLGIFYTGESYKDSYGSLSGSIMTLSLGGRYYLNNVGKTSPHRPLFTPVMVSQCTSETGKIHTINAIF